MSGPRGVSYTGPQECSTHAREPVKNFSTQKYMIDDFMRELHDQGVRTKPRVNLLLEAAKYFDAETAELKPEYADDSDQEEGDEIEVQ